MKSKPEDYRTYLRLLNDALTMIEDADTIESNRESIMSAMKLDKLMMAEKRSEESLKLILDLSVTPEAINRAIASSSRNIDNIDKLLMYNNEAYFRIIKFIQDKE